MEVASEIQGGGLAPNRRKNIYPLKQGDKIREGEDQVCR